MVWQPGKDGKCTVAVIPGNIVDLLHPPCGNSHHQHAAVHMNGLPGDIRRFV